MEKQYGTNSHKSRLKTIQIGYNASGAVAAARKGDVVVIVDIIDMSTTAQAALDAGALKVFGAAPDGANPPVKLNPEKIGYIAGLLARQRDSGLIVIAEPRWGSAEERKENISTALAGIRRAGVEVDDILPNIGGQVSQLADFEGKVVLIASGTGGVAFDAAYNHGAEEVLTATISRTLFRKGLSPAEDGVKRALVAARNSGRGLSFIAASANSLEDVLACEFLARKAMEQGFLALD